jgi:uncharacterized protein YutE (UPF0331/DUF86 family)
MLDRERILSKLDELETYLRELRQVVPGSYAEYRGSVEKRRATERLLQIAVECVLDVCSFFVSGLRLGLPAEEEALFDKLEGANLISPVLGGKLRSMRGFRNILVHEYGAVDDAVVYKIATTRVDDLRAFKNEVIEALRKQEKV